MRGKTIFTATLFLLATVNTQADTSVDPDVALKMLNDQNRQFERRVVKVSDRVFTAVGFHGANTSMIVGDTGVIIVDTLMGPTSAGQALTALREHSDLPVKAIVYTHSHGDHTGGTSAFFEGDAPPVIALEGFGSEHGVDAALTPIMRRRGARQFGRFLKPAQATNRGVAPSNTYDRDRAKGFVAPTKLLGNEVVKTEIGGVSIEFHPGPGETDDALFVWLPDDGVLLAGDNFYQAFPNLYAIRGTGYRNVLNWSTSVAAMAALEPHAVVPGHTMPIIGRTAAIAALTNYSAAIKSFYDQTVAGINAGKHPDLIAREVALPTDLDGKPYLTEFYGSVAHASRAIYAGLLGWFDGNPKQLNRLHPKDEAMRVARLAGGAHALTSSLERALAERDFQWALQLADHLKWLDDADPQFVRDARIKALRGLASREYNAPNRNYYLSYANELESGKLENRWD